MMKKWRNICSKHKNTAVSQDFLGPAKRRYSSFLFFVYRPLSAYVFYNISNICITITSTMTINTNPTQVFAKMPNSAYFFDKISHAFSCPVHFCEYQHYKRASQGIDKPSHDGRACRWQNNLGHPLENQSVPRLPLYPNNACQWS